jgi:hypothetical protein
MSDPVKLNLCFLPCSLWGPDTVKPNRARMTHATSALAVQNSVRLVAQAIAT